MLTLKIITSLDSETVAISSFAEASKITTAHLSAHGFGSSDFGGAVIKRHGEEIARVSYNGRVWDNGGKEIGL